MSATPAAPVNFGVGSWIERRARIAPAQVALVGGDPAFLESLFASGLLGAALAPVNHRLAADGIRAVLADTEPSVLMQHGATDPTPMPDSVRHRISVAGPLEEALDFEALVAESSDEPIQGLVGMEDVCLLSHTSGTTGHPRASCSPTPTSPGTSSTSSPAPTSAATTSRWRSLRSSASEVRG
jgi:acyl-CoA synthetase (AMP-forming)/AMP-acid ligase II